MIGCGWPSVDPAAVFIAMLGKHQMECRQLDETVSSHVGCDGQPGADETVLSHVGCDGQPGAVGQIV